MKLNEKTEQTEKVIHLMVTSLCERNCKYCCNNQLDLNTIPYVTDDELRKATTLCITGGEPFQFTNPCKIAEHYKNQYPNITGVYVYTNALELYEYLIAGKQIYDIDGVNVSIKTHLDLKAFNDYIVFHPHITELPSNRLYVFGGLIPNNARGFELIPRKWQEDFTPANDSIFRRV